MSLAALAALALAVLPGLAIAAAPEAVITRNWDAVLFPIGIVIKKEGGVLQVGIDSIQMCFVQSAVC